MKVSTIVTRATAAVLSLSSVSSAIAVTWTDDSSVFNAASTIAYDMMTFYSGNQSGIYDIPGMLPASPAYYWWEAGAMWATLIDYWYITGDTSYNAVTSQGMLFQVGANKDYMPSNQSKQLGNDDQGFWGMAAMTAAEYKFPDPPADEPQWLALAQAVFNEYTQRWDVTSCNGGLKWQIYTFNTGYDYKNSIANGCLFNIGARLARYTDNSTYMDWANKAWDWVERVGLIDDNFYIYDGTDDSVTNSAGVPENCTAINHLQYSYNPGVWLLGAAHLYNITNGTTQATWKTRVEGILDGALTFFGDTSTGVFVERMCESAVPMTCDTDMLTFKGILVRNLGAASLVAPFIATRVATAVAAQASAAALQCSGSTGGRMCGFKWSEGAVWDGTTGAGQQMAALEALITTRIAKVAGPVTASTGGTSVGNNNAGASGAGATSLATPIVVTGADRAGAGILTALVVVSAVGAIWWMTLGD